MASVWVFLFVFCNWRKLGSSTICRKLGFSAICRKLGSSQIRGGSSSYVAPSKARSSEDLSRSVALQVRGWWPKPKHFDGPKLKDFDGPNPSTLNSNILMGKTHERGVSGRWACKDVQNVTLGNIQIHLTRTANRFLIICHTWSINSKWFPQ